MNLNTILEAIESSSPEELAKLRELILKIIAPPPPTKCTYCLAQDEQYRIMTERYGQNWSIGHMYGKCTCKELGLK